MKKQVSFEDAQDSYRFSLVGHSDSTFVISKDTLTFSSNDFYKTFFKGLSEKPEYELVQPKEKLQDQAKHIFDTVGAILKKACDSIDATWFIETEEPTTEETDKENISAPSGETSES